MKQKLDNHGILEMTEVNYETNRPTAANPIKVQDLTFRDGHQSLFATRGRTEDKLIVAEHMDEIGFHSMEVWGGATFDTMHRYLNEDPWERIRTLKKHITKTPFSMLLRGQNLVGYRNYADDVVEAFTQRACDNGIDIFRVFDALNDFRNFETVHKVITKNKKHFQGTICYSLTEQRLGGEVYNLDYYLEKAKELIAIGVDSICIKDMAGLISPYDAYSLIKMLKENVEVPIHLHSHFTSGMADLAMLKAIEAGVDIIDTCMSPYAYRSSHPAIEPLVITLLGTNRDTGFDIKQLVKISEELEKVVPKYMHYMNQTKLSIIDTNVLLHQTPGGMLSNLVNQLQQLGEIDKLDAVFEELPNVRKDLGQVPLVTPTSQIIGIQTVNNVLFDKGKKEYSKITEQVKDLCYGLYGKTPRPINADIQKKALKDYPRGEKPITERPGEILVPELEKAKQEINDLAKNLDDVLIYALFPVTGKRFLKWKYGHEEAPDEVKPKSIKEIEKEKELVRKAIAGELIEKPTKEVPEKPENIRSFDVFVDGEYFKVEVDDKNGTPAISTQGAIPRPSVSMPTPKPAAAPTAQKTAAKPALQTGEKEYALKTPLPGMVVAFEKQVGETVIEGETVVVVEAMKMNNNIDAPASGRIKAFTCDIGQSMAKEDVLCIIETE